MMESRTEDKPVAEGSPDKKRRKIGWKQLVAVAVAVVIVWQVGKAVSRSGGKAANAAASSTSSPAPTSVPTSRATPRPTVTLGGQAVAANGGAVILVNPGLVAPGGVVNVQGSGFDPSVSVAVWLRPPHANTGTLVARGMTSKYGTLNTGFTMPSSTGATATLVAQEAGGTKMAVAQIVTPIGVGHVVIDGKSAGKPGDTVTVSASGFGPGEKVDVFWGRVAGTPAATLTADGSGSISEASVPVGIAATGSTTLVLVGEKTKTTATAPYQMLGLYPVLTPHPYAVQPGHSVTLTGSGFAPGEQVLLYLNAASGTPALTATASSGGGLSLSFVVPFGLKGSQTLTAIGEESRAAVNSGLDILSYSPSAQASTYGALPGTTISFYATGFAANEVVEVYLGRGQGSSGQLVSAFRVDGHGNAAAAGNYVIPNGTGPALYFTLVGEESGGTATAKVSVTAPSQPVTVPSQPPYALPPSLGGTPSPQPSADHSSVSQSGRGS